MIPGRLLGTEKSPVVIRMRLRWSARSQLEYLRERAGHSVGLVAAGSDSYTLQTNDDLVAGSWAGYGGTVSSNGGTNSVAITPSSGNLFFRLHIPDTDGTVIAIRQQREDERMALWHELAQRCSLPSPELSAEQASRVCHVRWVSVAILLLGCGRRRRTPVEFEKTPRQHDHCLCDSFMSQR